MSVVNDVREALQALARSGDYFRGSEWALVQEWHADVVKYVRAALGELAAGDVALRLRCSRGATQAEKEANAIGFVNDWLGTQALGLTPEKIVPGFTGELPVDDYEEVEPEPEIIAVMGVSAVSSAASVIVPASEGEYGDVGPSVE